MCSSPGLGSTGRAQVILFLGGAGGLPSNETTFAKILQKQGYTTGIVGMPCMNIYIYVFSRSACVQNTVQVSIRAQFQAVFLDLLGLRVLLMGPVVLWNLNRPPSDNNGAYPARATDIHILSQ